MRMRVRLSKGRDMVPCSGPSRRWAWELDPSVHAEGEWQLVATAPSGIEPLEIIERRPTRFSGRAIRADAPNLHLVEGTTDAAGIDRTDGAGEADPATLEQQRLRAARFRQRRLSARSGTQQAVGCQCSKQIGSCATAWTTGSARSAKGLYGPGIYLTPLQGGASPREASKGSGAAARRHRQRQPRTPRQLRGATASASHE